MALAEVDPAHVAENPGVFARGCRVRRPGDHVLGAGQPAESLLQVALVLIGAADLAQEHRLPDPVIRTRAGFEQLGDLLVLGARRGVIAGEIEYIAKALIQRRGGVKILRQRIAGRPRGHSERLGV